MSNYKSRFQPTNDDTLECLFFSTAVESDALYWEDLCIQLNREIKSLTNDYVWQKDEFQIHIPIENDDSDMPHLSSSTCFGDNIEDEWFIVYIIFELTKNYKALIVQVKDNDGDFLLIESADYLPPWANPESTENRVFINNNHVHVIPPEMAKLQSKLELKEAIELIKLSPESTKASHDIEKAIINRISKYPEKALENIHKVFVKLPRHLATLLTLKPNFIAPIVETYCNHDVIDARCCKNVSFDDCITIEVRFTKFLYAMLVHTKLIPYIKDHVGLVNDKKSLIGLKLLCGFQMIKSKSSNVDLFASQNYNQFINSLKQKGYFKDNVEGSKDYNQLLNKANDYFLNVEHPVSSNISHRMLELMSSNEFLELKDVLAENLTEPSDDSDNTEEWLNINPDKLNDLLESRYGKKTNLKNNDVISSERITTELSNFLKQSSDFEGIEPTITETGNDDIEFEPDEFVAGLEKMLSILSTGNNTQHVDSDFSSNEDDQDDLSICSDDDNDIELRTKLQCDQLDNLKDSKNILTNIVQSMKEEKGSSGPSSNLLRSLGVEKSDLLDSDDDE